MIGRLPIRNTGVPDNRRNCNDEKDTAAGLPFDTPVCRDNGSAAAESWKKLGDGTRLETEGNIWRIQPGTSRENGIWSSHALTLSRAKYRVSFRYRLGGGVLHFIVKHGDNTYSLLEKRLPATGGEWKEFQAEMTEDRPGTHGSLWFLCTGRLRSRN